MPAFSQGQIPHANGSTHNCFAKSSGISAGPCTSNDEVSANDQKETFRRSWPILSHYLSVFSGIVGIVKTSVAVAGPRAQN